MVVLRLNSSSLSTNWYFQFSANKKVPAEHEETFALVHELVSNADLESVVMFGIENDWDTSDAHPTINIACKFFLATLLKHCGIPESLTV